MQTKNKKWGVYDIVFIGVMSAVVFVSNFLSIPIGDVTRIHFGNVFCVLSGLLLGGIKGGLCAGIGSFFYDLTNPFYIAESPITFLFKFVIGFFAGTISHSGDRGGKNIIFNIIGSVTGSVAYVILYLCKNFIEEFYLIKNPIETVMTKMIMKGSASLINGMIAVVIAVILAPIFIKVIEKSGFGKKLEK